MATRASYATKSDVSEVRDEVRLVRTEVHEFRDTLRAEIQDVRGELHSVRDSLRAEIHEVRHSLRGEMHALRDELKGDIRGVGAMVESLRSDISALAEGFSTVARKSELAEVDERLSARTALLEDSVRSLAADVRKARIAKPEKRAGSKR